MCKHVLFNSFTASDIQTLKAFQGRSYDTDGFGAILRDSSGAVRTVKALDRTDFYVDLISAIHEHLPQTLVVHHRTSTNGDGIDYAHPFELDEHYLTHNGVVDIPSEYPTRTSNDSEALLHHLVATNKTSDVSGYFSVFLLTRDTTQVIVDDTAPIYTDGRVYSSIQLGENFAKITNEWRHLDRVGNMLSVSTVQKTSRQYGRELSHLSLGTSYPVSDYTTSDYSRDWYEGGFTRYEPRSVREWSNDDTTDPVTTFIDTLSINERFAILKPTLKDKARKKYIKRIAAERGIALDNYDTATVLDYL